MSDEDDWAKYRRRLMREDYWHLETVMLGIADQYSIKALKQGATKGQMADWIVAKQKEEGDESR